MVIQTATTLSPAKARPSFPHNDLIKSMSDSPISRPTHPPIRKLKSSLKISHPEPISRSKSEIFLTSPEKNVRFAIELTTVKRFDKNAEPSSISNENSPTLSPVDSNTAADDVQLFNNEDCWFNDSSLVTNLLKNEKKFRYMNSLNNMFKLDLYDSEDEDDIDEHINSQAEYGYTYNSLSTRGKTSENKSATSSLATQATNICDWKLHCTDLVPFKIAPPLFTKTLSASDLQGQLTKYLNGQNVKLHSLTQLGDDSSKITGLVYVKNLSFEKYLEIKFTFNSWRDIHYVTANFNRTINSNVDEFKFTIDLNSLKYILLIKRIITMEKNTSSCPLNVELCCRYDVNNETYYDNNNGKNYHLFMTTFKKGGETKENENEKEKILVVVEPASQTDAAMSPKEMKARFVSSNPTLSRFLPQSRKFSEDTDYYNTSPLKHLYHNDTTSWVKPKRLNVVLDKLENATPPPPPPSSALANDTARADKITKDNNNVLAPPTASNSIDLPILGSQHQSLYSGSSSYSSSSSSISSSLSFASSNNSSTNSSSASCSFPLTELDNFDYANLYEPNDTFTTANLLNHSLNSLMPEISTPSFFGGFRNENTINNTDSKNLVTSLEDSYEDKQSVITDTTMDENNKTSTINNSTDTLIKPSKENGTVKENKSSANSTSAPSSSQNRASTILNDHSNGKSDLKYVNYQSLLDSHCFYNHPSSPNLQSTSFSSAAPFSGISQASDIFDYENEDSDSNQIAGEIDNNSFPPHFYLDEDDKSACLSDDALIDHHRNTNPFINTFSSSPPILSQEVDRWRL